MTSTEHKSLCYHMKKIFKPKILFCLGLVSLVHYFLSSRTSVKDVDTDFDYFLFTQRWLPTACIQYIERPSSYSRRCTLPSNFKMWAIHGLWPTKNDHMGPFFCNTSLPFDLDALQPIMSDLMTYWPNIEGGRDFSSLWNHEWEKHGTCAAQLQSLDTEIKYFKATLGLYRNYNITNILQRRNIVPSLNQGYPLSDLFSVFQSALGRTPQIHCIFETHTGQPYLFEIRMCFDYGLKLIDCHDGRNRFNRFSLLTNCPRDGPIMLPDTSAPPAASGVHVGNPKEDFRQQLFDLLRLIQFMQWIVL